MTQSSEETPLVNKNTLLYHVPADDVLEAAVNDAYVEFVDDDDDDNDYDEDHMDDNGSDSDDEIYWIRQQRHENKSLPWMKRPSVWMVGLCLFFTAMASSAAEPSRTSIIFKLACNSLMENSSKGMCDPTDTQIMISNLTMAIQLTTGVVTMVALGKIGQFSDQYGRKIFISAIIGVSVLGKIIQFLALQHNHELPFYTILFSDILSAIAGGIVTLVALTNSYISDVVEAHERIYSLGLSVASLFIGLSLGPMIGNLILMVVKKFGSKPTTPEMGSIVKRMSDSFETKAMNSISSIDFVPLKFEIFLLLLVFLYSVFILPESRSEKARQKSRSMSQAAADSEFDRNSLLSIGSEAVDAVNCKETLIKKVLHIFDFLKPLRLLTLPIESVPANRRHRIKIDRITVISLVIIDCLTASFGQTLGYISVLYGVYKFQWTSTDLGHFMAVACSSRATVLIVLSPIISHSIFHKHMGFKIFKKQFDMVDYSMAEVGLVAECVGYMLLYFANSTLAFFLVLIIQSLSTIAPPTLNSAIIKYFPELKIGEYFGATSVIKNFLTLGTPLVFVSTYKYALQVWGKPELVFAVLAFVSLIFCIALRIVKRVLHLSSESEEDILLLQRSRRSSSVNSRRPSLSSAESMDVSSIESDAAFRVPTSPVPGNSRSLNFERSNSFCRN